jgi:hypothetical protein
MMVFPKLFINHEGVKGFFWRGRKGLQGLLVYRFTGVQGLLVYKVYWFTRFTGFRGL